jgi:uncharacterized protein YqjF (DUF2071 family)
MRMRWIRPVFLHFHVPRKALLSRLPPGVTLDADGGHGVVSVVALHAVGPAPNILVATPLRALVHYQRLDVRTYVTGPEGPGVLILETLVDHRWPLAARLLGMPYRREDVIVEVDDAAVALRAPGLSVRALPAPGAAVPVAQGTKEQFLLDRVVTYGRGPAGPTYAVQVQHPPWRIRPIEVGPDSMLDLSVLDIGELAPSRVLSAQLAETVEVRLDTIKTVDDPSGRVRRAATRLALNVIDAAL